MTLFNNIKLIFVFSLILFFALKTKAQNFAFNYNTSGKRVCLVSSKADTINNKIIIYFLDSASNTSTPIIVSRRALYTNTWSVVANNLPATTGHWIDANVARGDVWEYQIKRNNTWLYNTINYNATGYTIGALLNDNTAAKKSMILLVANDVSNNLSIKYNRLKKELTADGWLVNEIIVPRALAWDSKDTVVTIKNQIKTIYNNAPLNNKPSCLFILGHVPLPRSGSTSVTAPDEHDENKGARGCDAYYADIDGIFTDLTTYSPGGLVTPLAINLPNDFKWDQDFFPSDIEMAFGRVDFADITDYAIPEMQLIENYLDRLSNYRNVNTGFNMGEKSAFFYGYDNSNDGSYRSLPNISEPQQVYQNNTALAHPTWVKNNGPFKIYMQNVTVPSINDWNLSGMDATVFTSDQSYWGFGDVPQNNTIYSRIRALLAANSKCLITLWTTTGINIFHQACKGEAFGIATKQIMNHNATNNKLEKAPQDYDTQNWWNRTHFAFYGDPTINLYQIAPPTNVTIALVSSNYQLQWNASLDANIIGYNVYSSFTEFGEFTKINNATIVGNSFNIPNYQNGYWYMVKAIKIIKSGCGLFYHASLGVAVKATISTSINNINTLIYNVSIFPNPAINTLQVKASSPIKSIVLFSTLGVNMGLVNINTNYNPIINVSHLNNGLYCLQIKLANGAYVNQKFVKL
jgi:hypothetical protein